MILQVVVQNGSSWCLQQVLRRHYSVRLSYLYVQKETLQLRPLIHQYPIRMFRKVSVIQMLLLICYAGMHSVISSTFLTLLVNVLSSVAYIIYHYLLLVCQVYQLLMEVTPAQVFQLSICTRKG